jgi:MFS transporter, DHA2 family, multidrug resistance protein
MDDRQNEHQPPAGFAVHVRPLVGLVGVLFATFIAQFNDQLTSIALPDISAGLGLGHDPALWFRGIFHVSEVVGMCSGPSLALIVSPRRFALGVIAALCLSTVLLPFVGSQVLLMGLRVIQGLLAGFTIPLLMASALRVLDPPIRLYGLAVYALSATFTPNLATTLAAFWTDTVGDWRFIFLQALPLSAIAGLLIWWGMDQDPPQYQRIRSFDWRGVVLVAIGFGSLSVVLEQGDRLDWFNSQFISTLALAAVVAIPLFLLNEMKVETPLVRLDLFKRRNYTFAVVGFMLLVIIGLSASQVPISFLEQVQGYRPLQAHVLTLSLALPQLILLPITALVLDIKWLDSRWIAAVGLLCILGACFGGAHVTSSWNREQFLLWELLQSLGQAFFVMSLLLDGTNAVKAVEGPFASALFNTPRVIAQGLGIALLDLINRWRGSLHRIRILDELGQRRADPVRLAPARHALVHSGLTVAGPPRPPAAIAALNDVVVAQTITLTTIDTFLIMGALVVVLIALLALLPVRTLPPRLALAKR